MTAPWTVRPRCRPLRRRRAPGWHIRASRRSGGGAGSRAELPPARCAARRTRAGGRPPVGSGSRHGPDRLHRFQKYRGRAGRGAAEAAVPAVISSPAHCGAPGSWTFARKSPDRAGAAAGERSGRGPGGHQRSQYGYYTTIFAARASIFNQVCGLCAGELSGCLLRRGGGEAGLPAMAFAN